MKVALIQMDSTGSRQENERKALKWLEQSAKQGADVICLSESFVYWGKEKEERNCSLVDIEKYQDFARKKQVNLVLGSVSLKVENSDKTTNTCFVIDRNGRIVHRYDKKYMYQVNKPDLKIDETERTIARKNEWNF